MTQVKQATDSTKQSDKQEKQPILGVRCLSLLLEESDKLQSVQKPLPNNSDSKSTE